MGSRLGRAGLFRRAVFAISTLRARSPTTMPFAASAVKAWSEVANSMNAYCMESPACRTSVTVPKCPKRILSCSGSRRGLTLPTCNVRESSSTGDIPSIPGIIAGALPVIPGTIIPALGIAGGGVTGWPRLGSWSEAVGPAPPIAGWPAAARWAWAAARLASMATWAGLTEDPARPWRPAPGIPGMPGTMPPGRAEGAGISGALSKWTGKGEPPMGVRVTETATL
mmetsp:Transcript_31289/g.99822  ORF Transcript_31289/g.99822 Transcript_31289/m.99822 type:complete len:225 (+) Transcript_31289:269-943(+)